MIYYVAFYKLKPEVDQETLESMLRRTRTLLLKIPETLAVRSGRNLEPDAEWPFFYTIECESKLKLKMLQSDAHYLKFQETVIKPYTIRRLTNTYELEPGKDLKYS